MHYHTDYGIPQTYTSNIRRGESLGLTQASSQKMYSKTPGNINLFTSNLRETTEDSLTQHHLKSTEGKPSLNDVSVGITNQFSRIRNNQTKNPAIDKWLTENSFKQRLSKVSSRRLNWKKPPDVHTANSLAYKIEPQSPTEYIIPSSVTKYHYVPNASTGSRTYKERSTESIYKRERVFSESKQNTMNFRNKTNGSKHQDHYDKKYSEKEIKAVKVNSEGIKPAPGSPKSFGETQKESHRKGKSNKKEVDKHDPNDIICQKESAELIRNVLISWKSILPTLFSSLSNISTQNMTADSRQDQIDGLLCKFKQSFNITNRQSPSTSSNIASTEISGADLSFIMTENIYLLEKVQEAIENGFIEIQKNFREDQKVKNIFAGH